MSDLTPNIEERAALDAVLDYLDIVRGWEPIANMNELIPAIHVLQHFVIQHVIHRADPDNWGAWYKHHE